MMKENELNTYRFLSGEDPTDEMLQAIMKDACDDAVKEDEEAQKRFEADYERQYRKAYNEWYERINAARNGHV